MLRPYCGVCRPTNRGWLCSSPLHRTEEPEIRFIEASIKSLGAVPSSTARHWLYRCLAREDRCHESCANSARRTFEISNLEAQLLMDRDAWNSHEWSAPEGRQVEIEAGKPLIQRHCTRCKRDFVENIASGERHAMVFVFFRLAAHITAVLFSKTGAAPVWGDRLVRARKHRRRVTFFARVRWQTGELGLAVARAGEC